MKKLLLSLLIVCSGLLCAKDLNVVCTTVPVMAMTRTVLDGVPGFKVSLLLPPAIGCPHDYSLTPADMRKLGTADMIVINGLGMENFLTSALNKLKKDTVVMDASKGVTGLLDNAEEEEEEEHAEEEDDEHEHKHHHHGAKNEHYFAAPGTAAEAVKSLADQFAKRYPDKAEQFKKNAARITELQKLQADYAAFAKTVPDAQKHIVIQHTIFAYLAKDAGLHSIGCILVDEVREPSAAEAAHLIREMKEEHVSCILAEKGRVTPMVKMLSRESGVPVLELTVNPADSDPEKFVKDFRDNLNVLKKAFSGK